MCPGCDQPAERCRCGSTGKETGRGGQVRVGRETKGRKGKGVTVISGLPLDATELAALARELKTQCGAGGKVRDGVIEIQGDHRQQVVALLTARGYTAKRSGG